MFFSPLSFTCENIISSENFLEKQNKTKEQNISSELFCHVFTDGKQK